MPLPDSNPGSWVHKREGYLPRCYAEILEANLCLARSRFKYCSWNAEVRLRGIHSRLIIAEINSFESGPHRLQFQSFWVIFSFFPKLSGNELYSIDFVFVEIVTMASASASARTTKKRSQWLKIPPASSFYGDALNSGNPFQSYEKNHNQMKTLPWRRGGEG